MKIFVTTITLLLALCAGSITLQQVAQAANTSEKHLLPSAHVHCSHSQDLVRITHAGKTDCYIGHGRISNLSHVSRIYSGKYIVTFIYEGRLQNGRITIGRYTDRQIRSDWHVTTVIIH